MPQGPIPAQNFVQAPGKVSVPLALGPGNYQSAYLKQGYLGANPYANAVTTSAALATTYVGLCLSNPAGNTNNLVLLSVAAELVVAPAALTGFGLILGYAAGGITAHTTALTPLNAFLNGPATTATLDSACTLVGTPVWGPYLGVTPSATGVVSVARTFDGSIIIPPGGYVAIGTTIAGPASGFIGSMQWLETAV